MKNIIIVGAGGFGREVLNVLQHWNNLNLEKDKKPEWNIIGFKDDRLKGQKIHDHNVWGIEDEINVTPLGYVVAISDCRAKKSVVHRLGNVDYYTVLHPWVVIYNRVQIGKGTIICPPSVISTDIKIGCHVAINSLSSIGHDSIIGDYCTINAAMVNGDDQIGNEVYLGSGSVLRNKISIGDNSVIGAGSVVVKDIPPNVVAVGVPAKILRKLD
ncbi:MAG: NeuD/PglB/VioB family sugar acetyltransferase [Eubacteriales bacterium]